MRVDNRGVSVDHYENFPVASWLCPPALRPAVSAIYWFARTADDIADEGVASPAERLAQLADYRSALKACIDGHSSPQRWPAVFGPLGPVIRATGLPTACLFDLISAFEQDTRQRRWRDRAELLDYCSRSANPVGRMLLHLYGVHDPRALQRSDAVCTALQLINFWQDLGVDVKRGRLYLPLTDCARHGVPPEAVLDGVDSAALRRLVADAVAWARAMMLEGAPLVHQVPGRAGWELRGVVQGGLRILDKIEASGHDSLRHRPRLRAWDVLPMAWGAWRMRPARPAPASARPAP